MMEMTTVPYYSEPVAKCNLEKNDSVEVNSKKSCNKTVREEKGVRSLDREVMVERVSSTTEHSPWRTPEKQQGAETCRSTEEMLEGKALSIKLPREEKDRYSRTPSIEESQHRSHKSRKQLSSSSGGEKSVRREHSGPESTSNRNMGPQYNTSTKKHSEREAKRVEPEVSSSSLVLAPPRRVIPPPPRISSQSIHDDRGLSSLPHKERDRSSRPPSGNMNTSKKHDSTPTKNCQDKRKQKYFKEKDKAARQKYERNDSAPHYSGSEKSISYEKMVEMQVREIRKNLEKMSKKVLETKEGSTPESVRSELRHEEDKGLSEGYEKQDTKITAFLPSKRCCSPPPKPTEITKYWSDADETEDDSDTEKHMMHVNSVNIVLNYLKTHSDKYYRKGKEAGSPNLDGGNMQPKGRIVERLTLLSQSDSQWRGPKGKHVRKRHKPDGSRNVHSRYPANQWHAGPSVQETESPARVHYDHHSISRSPLNGLSSVIGLLASLSDQQSRSPSRDLEEYERGRSLCPSPDQMEHCYRSRSPLDYQETQALQHRSSRSPLWHGDSRSRQLHSTHRDEELYSPWHKRRSLTRESCSPLRYRSDPLRNRGSPSLSGNRVASSRNRGSHSPSRYRDDHVRNRGSHSPSRYRESPLRNRGSHSPSRYRDECVRNRGSYSPSRYRDDSLRERGSHSPSRHRGDSLRDRRLQEEGSFRETERNTEFSPLMSARSPFQRSPEQHLSHAQLGVPHFSHGLSQRDCSGSPSCKDHFQPPAGVSSPYSESGPRRPRSRSSEKDVSPRLHKGRQDIRYRSSLEFGKTPLTAGNAKSPSRWGKSESFTSKTKSQQKNKKNIFGDSDYFFNPAVENTEEDYQADSGPFTEKDHIQEGEGYFTGGSSWRSNSRKGTNTSAPAAYKDMVAHDGLSDPVQPDHVIKPQGCDSNNQGNFTPRTYTQISLDDEPTIDQPEDYLKDSSTVSTFHQPSFVPDAYDRQLLTGFAEPSKPLATQENLPGPSGISSVTSSGRRGLDDPPYWLSESDHDTDLEDFNSCLSEVSSLIAHHEAATSDNTPSDAASAVPTVQKAVTTEIVRKEQEKACLTLNSAEMSTLLSLIEIAKEHTATGDDLSTNLPKILEKIRQNTTTSKNVSESSGGHSGGDKKQWPNMSQVSGDIQDSTMDAGKSKGTTSGSNIENDKESHSTQKGDTGVTPSPNKEKKQVFQDKVSASNTVQKLSETKDSCKSQQSKSKLQVGKANDKPSGSEKLSETKDSSKPQQNISKLQVGKANDKPSGGKKLSETKDSSKPQQNKRKRQVGKAGDRPSGGEKLPETKDNSKSQQNKSKKVGKAGDQSSGGVKLSKTKDSSKPQQNKSKRQVGKAGDKPSGGETLSKTIDSSKSQQSKSKLQVGKANDKPSGGEKTQVQSSMKKGSDIPLQENDQSKEQSLKNKGVVRGTKCKKNSDCKDEYKRRTKGNKRSAIEKTFADMQHVRIYVEDHSASKESVAQSRRGKPYKVKGTTSLRSSKKAPLKQVGERLLVRDNSDSSDDSESLETKKAKDAPPASESSPQNVYSYHRETIVLDHSVSMCLACKNKLVPDEYTSIVLSTGTVTMRCRMCHTFTRMEKVMPLDYYIKTSNPQKATLQKKSTCSKTSEASKTPGTSMKGNSELGKEVNVTEYEQNEENDSDKQISKENHSSQGIQETKNEEKITTPSSTKETEKLPNSVGDKVPPKNTLASKTSHEDNSKKYKTQRKESETSTSASEDKDKTSNDDKQELPDSFDTIDPSLRVFPWSSSRKRKKIYEELKLNYDSSTSDEEYAMKRQHKRPTKRKRIINSPSSYEDSDDDTSGHPKKPTKPVTSSTATKANTASKSRDIIKTSSKY